MDKKKNEQPKQKAQKTKLGFPSHQANGAVETRVARVTFTEDNNFMQLEVGEGENEEFPSPSDEEEGEILEHSLNNNAVMPVRIEQNLNPLST